MKRRPWDISRRTFLRGAGAAVALPFLEAMVPWTQRLARAGKAARPRRMLLYFQPNGMNMTAWTPATTGRDYALTSILEPLAPVKDDVLVVSGLDNASAVMASLGDHARGTGSFATATRIARSEAEDVENGVSVDQLAAQRIGAATPFPSLVLGIEGESVTTPCDPGYSCAYMRNVSWSSPTTPVAKEVNPRTVFTRLFGLVDPKLRRYRLSVLDIVKGDAERLQAKLGVTDRRKMDEYLTSLRELEQRLERGAPDTQCAAGVAPPASENWHERLRQMADLMVLAFQCDLTRVISFMGGHSSSMLTFPFLDIYEGHHFLSHHGGNAERLAQVTIIDRWEVAEFVYLVERMKAVEDYEGTLLDSSVLMFSSELSNGHLHLHTDLPILLAGRGGGALGPGRHVRYPKGTPVANLYISMLAAVGAKADSFGDDGTGPLPDLA